MSKLPSLKVIRLLDRLTKNKLRRTGASLRDAKYIVELSFENKPAVVNGKETTLHSFNPYEDASLLSIAQKAQMLSIWEACKPKLTKEVDVSHLGFSSPVTEVPYDFGGKIIMFGTGGNQDEKLKDIFVKSD